MRWEDIGLTVFVIWAFGTLGVLGYDLHLRLTGQEMITTYVRCHPWCGWLVYVAISVGVGGLMVHFMGTNKP